MIVFGKIILKISAYAVLAAVIIAMGGQILISAIGVVRAARFGDYSPFLLIAFLVLILSITRRRTVGTTKLVQFAVRIGLYLVAGYFATILFLIIIPYGLILALCVVGFSLFGIVLVTEPGYLSKIDFGTGVYPTSLPVISKIGSCLSKIDGTHLVEFFTVIQVNGDTQMLLDLLKERPRLQISVVFCTENVFLIVPRKQTKHLESILESVLSEALQWSLVPDLLAEAVLSLPLIDDMNGMQMSEYMYTQSEEVVRSLIAASPSRLVVSSVSGELIALFPDNLAPGIASEPIPKGMEVEVILTRNYSRLRRNVMIENTP